MMHEDQKIRSRSIELLFLAGALALVIWAYFTINPLNVVATIATASKNGAVATGQHAVTGGPSLSASQVDAILSQYGSPAAGTGQTFYEQSLQTGINDAYALAFFQHESNMGLKGWAVVNRSIGNIRCTAGYSCNGGYRSYGSWEAGVIDWFNLIKNLYIKTWGLVTVEQIIPKYAPSYDHNDEAGYINAVINTVSSYQGGQQ
jgi:hypothetical protein